MIGQAIVRLKGRTQLIASVINSLTNRPTSRTVGSVLIIEVTQESRLATAQSRMLKR